MSPEAFKIVRMLPVQSDSANRGCGSLHVCFETLWLLEQIMQHLTDPWFSVSISFSRVELGTYSAS